MENPHSKHKLRWENAQLDKLNAISASDEHIHQQRRVSASCFYTRLWEKARGTEETDMKNSVFSMALKWQQHADV